jgi:hypothetical protein
MSNRKAASGPTAKVKEVFANGEERCEVRWGLKSERIDMPVTDWRLVSNVDLEIDPVTGRPCFLFHPEKRGRFRRFTGES